MEIARFPRREIQSEFSKNDSQIRFELIENRRLDPLKQTHSDQFWEQTASEFEWMRRWDVVQKRALPDFAFFSGGIMNPCVNMLDRHVVNGAGNRAALIWEAETGESLFLTYGMLLDEVKRCANVLKSIGISRGDPVAIFSRLYRLHYLYAHTVVGLLQVTSDGTDRAEVLKEVCFRKLARRMCCK